MPATSHASTLPDIDELRRRCQALAVLDAILCPEWEYRYFSFNADWSEHEMLASMRNGEGDDFQILFHPDGAVIKGYVHASVMAKDCPWPELMEGIPATLLGGIEEFAVDKTTFCLWQASDASTWTAGSLTTYPEGDDPDGSAQLLSFLDGNPVTYQTWGESYYGVRLNPRAVEHIYRHELLNPFIVKTLNSEVQLDEVRAEIRDIGFPV